MNEQQRAALENALKVIDVLNVHSLNLNGRDLKRLNDDLKNRGLENIRDQIIAALRGE